MRTVEEGIVLNVRKIQNNSNCSGSETIVEFDDGRIISFSICKFALQKGKTNKIYYYTTNMQVVSVTIGDEQ